MSQATPSWSTEQAKALEYAWGQYRVWAATSRASKARIAAWRPRVLALTILGALLATLGSQLAGYLPDAARAAGIAGGVLVALATYFGRELLKPDRERAWVRARSLAEALKGETFLFRTGAPPYDGAEAARALLARAKELLDQAADLPSEILTEDEKREGLPQGPLSIEDYVRDRVREQANRFYIPKAKHYEEVIKRWRILTLITGAAAAVLGVLGEWTAGWVALLTTIGTSVAAHVFANRYQFLIGSYQATARQLEYLEHEWAVAGAPEQDAQRRHRFVLDCEQAISVENSAWMARWMKDERKE